MSNILIVSPFFYPELISTGKYNSYLAKALVESGNTVTVCCSHPLYPNWIPIKSSECLDGMSIYRGGDLIRYSKSPLLRRISLELWFTFHVLITVFRIRKKIDSAVVIFPPTLFVCFLRFFLPKRVPLIGIIHDLQGVLGLSSPGLVKRLIFYFVKQVETYGFKKCARLILVSEGIKRQVIDDYNIDPKKCVVQYPFVTRSVETSSNDSLVDKFQIGFHHIVYSGALGEKQSPYQLLEIYQTLVNVRKDVICHIFSGGPLFEKVKELHKDNPVDRILFHDLVAEKDLPELFDRSTLHIIPQKSGTADAAFPSKLANILAAGVPVFAITDNESELSCLVDKSGIGKSCSSWDHSVLIPSLIDFLNQVGGMPRSESRKKVSDFVAVFFNVDNLVSEIVTGEDSSLKGHGCEFSPHNGA